MAGIPHTGTTPATVDRLSTGSPCRNKRVVRWEYAYSIYLLLKRLKNPYHMDVAFLGKNPKFG